MISQSLANSRLAVVLVAGVVATSASCTAASSELASVSISTVISSTSSTHGQRSLTISDSFFESNQMPP